MKDSIIVIYCDAGPRKLAMQDTYLDRFLIANVNGKGGYLGEYRAILLTLTYIMKTYRNKTIVILSDSVTCVDVINGNVGKHRKPDIKYYSDQVCSILKIARQDNNISIEWIPREQNDAGYLIECLKKSKVEWFVKKCSLEVIDFPDMRF